MRVLTLTHFFVFKCFIFHKLYSHRIRVHMCHSSLCNMFLFPIWNFVNDRTFSCLFYRLVCMIYHMLALGWKCHLESSNDPLDCNNVHLFMILGLILLLEQSVVSCDLYIIYIFMLPVHNFICTWHLFDSIAFELMVTDIILVIIGWQWVLEFIAKFTEVHKLNAI